MTQGSQVVGIDVSKATLDVGLYQGSRAKKHRFANQASGFESLVDWLHTQAKGCELHVCLEATATYHDAVARFLHDVGIKVSILPSSRLPAFRESEGKRSKTDEQDALLLARYGEQKQPVGWEPLPSEQEHLQVLMQRLEALDKMSQQERNRLENSRLPASIREQIQQHRQQMATWRKELLKEAISWVKAHEELNQGFAFLLSQKGIGPLSALRMLCLLGSDSSRFSGSRQVVAYVGMDVVERQSGTSVRSRGHISKRGSGSVRKWLAMCALVARRWDPDMQQWAEELKARGKCAKQIQVAIMRKLLQVSYGLLKHQQAYERQTAWPTHGPTAPALLKPKEKAAA
jgi:transposase